MSIKQRDTEIELISKVCLDVISIMRFCDDLPIFPAHEMASEWFKAKINRWINRVINENLTPEGLHGAWLDEKVAAGWVFGNMRNEQEKTDPFIRRYKELPSSRKKEYNVFVEIIKTMSFVFEELSRKS
jgi:hypothetical protein